jgi:O-succinylhomoserine sulfhydrylase
MAAVFNSLTAFLRAGDRVVASRALFGSCFVILDELLPRWGISCDFLDGHDLGQWERALSTPAQAVFFESPSNPMQDLVDVRAVCDLAHAAGARVVVDNVFATPLLQRPLELGADIVVYSATKHIDGQGRCLGGVVLSDRRFKKEKLVPFLKNTGPSLSPFNAWVLLKGLETLPLRMRAHVANAEAVARHLADHAGVEEVLYPGLPSHPQHELARRQMKAGGTMVSFRVGGGRARAFEVLNRLRLVLVSNNLGDAKSLITHPASTTHSRFSEARRAELGIAEDLLRMSVGLEDAADILADLDQALAA